MIFIKQATFLLIGTINIFTSSSVEGKTEHGGHDDGRVLIKKIKKAKAGKKNPTVSPTDPPVLVVKNPTVSPTDPPTLVVKNPTVSPTDPPTPGVVGPIEIDKTILSCSVRSQPTLCSAPEASIDCVTLTKNMNECVELSDVSAPYVIYDPNNCGDGVSADPMVGCDFKGEQYCRVCGFGVYKPCATGFYESYYEPGDGQDGRNERVGNQTISYMLGIPVRVDCDRYYETLESFQSSGSDAIGNCFLDSPSFEYGYFSKNFTNETNPIKGCPPQLGADFSAYGNNARYQEKTTVNDKGVTYPQVDIPALAVGPVPVLIPESEFKDKCQSLALGQEINIFDAGEISSMALTARTMGERMLRPAVWSGNPLINCVEVVGLDVHTTRCGDYSAATIENPTSYTNTSNEPLSVGNMFPGLYDYQIPSAARPRATSQNGMGRNNKRVAKGMHGKGQTCIYGSFSFAPLKDLYAQNLGIGDFGYIPEDRRVGLLNPMLANNDVTFDTLVRLAGNKNITDVKDAHDVRIRGFGLKLFGVDKAFEKYGMPYNQIALAFLPPFDQPEDAKYTFGNFNFKSLQEQGNLDLTHVAVGTGIILGTDEAMNGTFFDPTTEEGARKPPDNVFVAHNVDNYYNGFILGGGTDPKEDTLTDVYLNPLEYVYGTAGALRAGPAASMKLSWAACPGEQTRITNVYDTLSEAFKDPNFFYTNLKETLEKLDGGDFKFCGYIQFQEDTCSEPIHDPTDRWLTDNINVFELNIPAQHVPTYNAFCDNTVLTPWRVIQEHQPQGYVQRVRMSVYVYASLFRLILNNGATLTEDSNGSVNESIGTNSCPYGWNEGNSPRPRFEPIAVDTKPKYQGPEFTAFTETLDIDPATGIIPDPNPDSSSGVCNTDGECKLPFGPGSVCENKNCTSQNNGLYWLV